jgi:hypothetical protein
MEKKYDSYKALFIVVLLIQSFLLVFYMNEKASFWIDEVNSYTLANSSCEELFIQKEYDESLNLDIRNKWIPNYIFKKQISIDSDKCFDYFGIYDNQISHTQPPFYYWIIHSVCSLFPEKFSKWYGLAINLVFFVIAQILLYKLSGYIFNNNKIALIICCFYGFSTALIDNYTFIGSNAVIPTFCFLTLNVFFKSLKSNFSIKLFIELFIIVVIGGLTHYLYWLYVLILTAVFFILSINNKEKKQSIFVLLTVLLGLIGVYLLFPFAFDQLKQLIESKTILLNQNVPEQYLFALVLLVRKILLVNFPYCNYLAYLLLISLSVFFIQLFVNRFYNNLKLNKTAFYLTVVPSVIVILLIALFINYNMLGITSIRYFSIFYPFIAIIIIGYCFSFKKPYLGIIIVLLSVISCFNGSHLVLRDTEKRYSKIEELIYGNNVIFYNSRVKYLQSILPQLSLCNKVFILSSNYRPSDVRLPENEKTYLLVFDDKNKPNIGNSKLRSGYLSDYKVDVYDSTAFK